MATDGKFATGSTSTITRAAFLHVLEHGETCTSTTSAVATRDNLEITEVLLELCGRTLDTHVQHVTDRPGHDRRYSLDCAKARGLGWRPRIDFERGLAETVAWYRDNPKLVASD